MSAHVLLILFQIESRESNKMRGLLFRNEFNKFNNTIAQMLDSFLRMTLTLLVFGIILLFNVWTSFWTSLRNVTKSVHH